jgi:hypothetical protein
MNSNAIVVGTGASLLGKKQGEKIDSFDFIFRSARCFVCDPTKQWKEDTGIKTTHVWVMYYHLKDLNYVPTYYDLLLLFNDMDSYEEPVQRFNRFSEYTNRYHLEQIVKKTQKKHFFSSNELSQLNSDLKITNNKNHIFRASGGLQALFFAINNFKTVYITGFDHFQTGYYFSPCSISARPAHNSFLEACYISLLIKNKIIKQL